MSDEYQVHTIIHGDVFCSVRERERERKREREKEKGGGRRFPHSWSHVPEQRGARVREERVNPFKEEYNPIVGCLCNPFAQAEVEKGEGRKPEFFVLLVALCKHVVVGKM